MNKYVIIFVIAFVIATGIYLSYVETQKFFNSNDYYFHLEKAKGKCLSEFYTVEACDNYPGFFHFLAGPFAENEFFFLILILSIILILIPALVLEKTNSYWSVALFFASGFPYIVLYSSILAQALLSVFFVLIIRNPENNKKDFLYLFFGLLTHSKALFVLLPLIAYKFFKNHKTEFLAPIVFLNARAFGLTELIKLFPLAIYPYMIFLGVPELTLISVYALAGFIISDFRPLLFIPLLLALWLPKIFNKRAFQIKVLISLNLSIYMIFQIILFFQDLINLNLA